MKKYLKYTALVFAVLFFFAGTHMPAVLTRPFMVTSYAENGRYENIKRKPDKKELSKVRSAVKEIKKAWKENYDKYAYEDTEDRYVEIKNTRLVKIKANTTTEEFKNVDYIVEFVLFSNHLRTAPYYMDSGVLDCVVVYKNGKSEVVRNPIRMYLTKTYNQDFSGFIQSVTDYEDAFNETFTGE